MRYTSSQYLNTVTFSDGHRYSLHFYGENEGAAVIVGPLAPMNTRDMVAVPEVHRESANDPDESRVKLAAVVEARGWMPA